MASVWVTWRPTSRRSEYRGWGLVPHPAIVAGAAAAALSPYITRVYAPHFLPIKSCTIARLCYYTHMDLEEYEDEMNEQEGEEALFFSGYIDWELWR